MRASRWVINKCKRYTSETVSCIALCWSHSLKILGNTRRRRIKALSEQGCELTIFLFEKYMITLTWPFFSVVVPRFAELLLLCQRSAICVFCLLFAHKNCPTNCPDTLYGADRMSGFVHLGLRRQETVCIIFCRYLRALSRLPFSRCLPPESTNPRIIDK